MFADFERREGPLPLPYLKRRLRGIPPRRDDVAEHIAFRDSFYQRNRLYDGDGLQALFLCWRSGQRSPIHNHAGSNCLVKVIEGTATEIVFAHSDCGKTPPRLVAPTACLCRGGPLSRYLADYHRFAHIRCLLKRVEGWAPPEGRPHYVG